MLGTAEAVWRLIAGVSVIYIVKKIFVRSSKPKNLPPGPPALPLVGSLPFVLTKGLKGLLPKTVELGFRYGKVYSFYFGPWRGVIINDPAVLKEAYQSVDCSGRPRLDTILKIHGGKLRGVIIQDGEPWKQVRRFTLNKLKEYGLGKNSMEVITERECSECIESLRKNAGRPVSTNGIFNIPVVNVLWEMMAGERLSHGDPRALAAIYALINLAKLSMGAILGFFFSGIASRFPRITGYEAFIKMIQENQDFVSEFVRVRKEKHSVGDQKDFTDLFLNKIKSTTDPKSDFYGKLGEENLVAVIRDIFLAGTETSSTTLRWLLLYLAVNQEAQAKLQAEIDRVLGDKFPTLDQRSSMPYTEAVVMETLRKSSLLPLGLFHDTKSDMKIGGYFVPKGTFVVSNIYAIHHDPDVWEKPEEFIPERFLSPDGSTVNRHHESLVPFSVGKRICPGEQLSKDQIFIFAARIFQQFSITWDPSQGKPSFVTNISTALSPLPHRLILRERKIGGEMGSIYHVQNMSGDVMSKTSGLSQSPALVS